MWFSFTIQSSKNRVFYAMAWSDLVFRLVSWENMDKKGLFYDDDFLFRAKKDSDMSVIFVILDIM
jgi:hypothetical protein